MKNRYYKGDKAAKGLTHLVQSRPNKTNPSIGFEWGCGVSIERRCNSLYLLEMLVQFVRCNIKLANNSDLFQVGQF